MVSISQALLYYKRKDIQMAIVDHAQDKEICGSYDMKGFSKRPDMLQYPTEVLEMVKRGITSFHCSEELWYNPLQISSSLQRTDLDKLRKGWDLLLDIDCKELEFSKIAGHYLVEAIKYHDIKSIYTKFSGNHGFHIAIPFEAFPDVILGKEVKNLFPEAPRKIAEYLKHLIEPHLRKALLEKYTLEKISELINKPIEEITKKGLLQPFEFLEVDTILISSRHLYRMPYSFNEKSGLVSVPIKPENIINFSKTMAMPENVKVTNIPFIERNIEKNQASKLFVEAFDFQANTTTTLNNTQSSEDQSNPNREFMELTEQVSEEMFPPCIQNILKGIVDGKKRAIFVLINFLSSLHWSKESIAKKLFEWNKLNTPPLKDMYITGQLNSLKYKKKKVLPPNCDNASYYKELNICFPDNLCNKIKNPVNYSRRKVFAKKRSEKEAEHPIREKLSEEQKVMRRLYREKLKKEKEAKENQMRQP